MTDQINEQMRTYLKHLASLGGSKKTPAQQEARRANAARATEARKEKLKNIKSGT